MGSLRQPTRHLEAEPSSWRSGLRQRSGVRGLPPALETMKDKNRKFYDALTQAMRIDDAPGAPSAP